MAADSNLSEFIERAKAGGASEQALVGILAARGWPEKEVYEALAAHYERQAGVAIPRRAGAGTAARDAFFYLLVFSTLATWTICLGSLAFTLIDRWLADPLFSPSYYQGFETETIAGSLAAILVAFPIYLFVSRSLVRRGRSHPEELASPVRKWLTYIALVIAAGVFIGDLIAALTYFLRGETTSRFFAKSSVVLLLSGGVFFYYFGGLRKSEEAGAPGKSRREGWMAVLSAVVVTAMVILGFWQIGAPSTQRTLRADLKRVQDLYQLSSQLHSHWDADKKLPEHLDELSGAAFADPITRMAYEYHPKEGSQYQLCATFSLESPRNEPKSRSDKWSHPAGRYCFSLNATQPNENPNIYLSD